MRRDSVTVRLSVHAQLRITMRGWAAAAAVLREVGASGIAAVALHRTHCPNAAVGEDTRVFVADDCENVLGGESGSLPNDVFWPQDFLQLAQPSCLAQSEENHVHTQVYARYGREFTCMLAFSWANSVNSDRFVTGDSRPTAATRSGGERAAYCAARNPPREIPAIKMPSSLASLCLAK